MKEVTRNPKGSISDQLHSGFESDVCKKNSENDLGQMTQSVWLLCVFGNVPGPLSLVVQPGPGSLCRLGSHVSPRRRDVSSVLQRRKLRQRIEMVGPLITIQIFKDSVCG